MGEDVIEKQEEIKILSEVLYSTIIVYQVKKNHHS